MAWTTPSTAVAGSTALTAAFWNEQVRDNSAYLKAEADAVGLVHITTVSISAAASVQINDCFSASYENYLIMVNGSNSIANDINLRFSSGGTPNTTANSYNGQRLQANSTTVSAARDIGNRGDCGYFQTSTQPSGIKIHIFRPYIAERTLWTSEASIDSSGGVSNNVYLRYGFHNQTASYDGIYFEPDGGNMTATFRIYGYRD